MPDFKRQTVSPRDLPPRLVVKWSKDMLSEGFVPFPKKLLRSLHRLFTGVGAVDEIAALLAVVDFKRPNLSRDPSLSYLAFVAGLEESEFEAALHRLESMGYIRIQGDADALNISITGLLGLVEKEASLAEDAPSSVELSPPARESQEPPF